MVHEKWPPARIEQLRTRTKEVRSSAQIGALFQSGAKWARAKKKAA